MMRAVCTVLALGGFALTGHAVAQEVERNADVVQTKVIIQGKVAEDKSTDKAHSGLVEAKRTESEAEHARREAVDALDQQTALGANHQIVTDTRTTAVVNGAVSQTGTDRDMACMQVGSIGTQKDCQGVRP